MKAKHGVGLVSGTFSKTFERKIISKNLNDEGLNEKLSEVIEVEIAF